MNRKVISVVVVVCLAVAGWVYASPYLTMRNISHAIDRGDADAVSAHVDFPALRENVKGHLLGKMQDEMGKPEMKDNPFAGLGQMLAVGVVNQLAETLVSPAGVMLMLKNGKPAAAVGASAAGGATDDSPRDRLAVDYQGWSKVFVHPRERSDVGFVFRRDGLLGWKLVSVKME